MNTKAVWTTLASVLAIAVWADLAGLTRPAQAQINGGKWAQRTPWGDPDLQGEWTSEGEFGVPFERPAEFGTRAVPDRRGIRETARRTSSIATSAIWRASTCSPARSMRRTCRFRIGANTTPLRGAPRS